MIIILNKLYKPKFLLRNKVLFCQIGKNGFVPKYKKKEGDRCTPIGKWKIKSIFLRREKLLDLRIKNFKKKKLIYIKKNFGWCDDKNSFRYNKFVRNLVDFNYSYEKLYRDDEVYDIIVELDYNQSPTIRNKGSAIFIHCSFDDSRDTKGCIALKKNNLKHLINNLQKINYIYIR